MTVLENAREKFEAASEKIKQDFRDNADRLGDKADELKADGDIRKAEVERDSVASKNEYKETLRNTT